MMKNEHTKKQSHDCDYTVACLGRRQKRQAAGQRTPVYISLSSRSVTLSLFNERSRLVIANGYSLKHANYTYASFFFRRLPSFILAASVLIHKKN